MKKLIAAACAIALAATMTVTAAAEIDLSGMTWEELIALQKQITVEQLSRDEWQEVEVPQGLWKVGEDIPAGKWTIRCTTGRSAHIYVGSKLESNGVDVDWLGSGGFWEFVYNEKNGSPGELLVLDVDLKEGEYIQIDHSSATFTPFAGKRDLGFKK